MNFLSRLKGTLQDLLASKKALTAIGGLLVLGAARYNIVLTEAQTTPIIALFSSLLLGQGLQDMGKAKALIEAVNPPPPAQVQNVNVEAQSEPAFSRTP